MTSLIDRLRHDYPQFVFRSGQTAHWAPDSRIIYYDRDDLTTLHELGHALLGHDTYRQDAELLQIERQAWLKAQQIAPHYGLSISDEVIEQALDSYRDWLHARSICPKCGQTGWQSRVDLTYTCPNCGSHWTANGAKRTTLRRYLVNRPKDQ